VALNGVETVGAKQCRLGYSLAAVRSCWEVEGEAKSPEWSNMKNGDTEDGRELIIRYEDDKDSVRWVFTCVSRFGVTFGTPTSFRAKQLVSQVYLCYLRAL
jgi:hypothetical protein